MFVRAMSRWGSRPYGRLSKRAVPSRTRAGREPKSVPKLKTSHSAFLGRKKGLYLRGCGLGGVAKWDQLYKNVHDGVYWDVFGAS